MMNFVRKVTHSDALKHIVDLPENLLNQEVELIILPLPTSPSHQTPPLPDISGPSVKGSLRQYANQSLLQQEKDAWKKGVQGKHEHR
jgi:hypothetical protein